MSTGHLTLPNPETLFDIHRDLEEEIAILMDRYTGHAGLEDFCRDGGAVHDVEAILTLDAYDEDAAEITGSFEVYFEERYHAGCRDITWSNSFKGSGTLTISTSTGAVELETEAEHIPSAADIADQQELEAELHNSEKPNNGAEIG
jgi:hypothetical protein